MSARNKHWYLLTYDVCCPKRLKKVHRFLRQHGVSVQQSVFLIRTHADGIETIQGGCSRILDFESDELAIIRTDAPDDMWRYGCGADQELWDNSHTRSGEASGQAFGLASIVKKMKRQLLWKS